MFQCLRRLLCLHKWIRILRLSGPVQTKSKTYIIKDVICVDYCPRCGSIRGRNEK